MKRREFLEAVKVRAIPSTRGGMGLGNVAGTIWASCTCAA